MLQAAGARKGAGGRDRRGDARDGSDATDRHPRRALRSAAPRPRRARAGGACEHFGIDDLRVAVVADAAHKPSEAPAGDRLAMARLAFAELDATVELETHRYTVDALEAAGYDDPIFLVGADELVDFPTWKEPERVLELARLGVATRPGYRAGSTRLARRPRSRSSSSSRIRFPRPRSAARARAGEPIDGLVAPAVAAVHRGARALPADAGFPGYTETALTSLEQARRIAALAPRSWPKTSSSST